MLFEFRIRLLSARCEQFRLSQPQCQNQRNKLAIDQPSLIEAKSQLLEWPLNNRNSFMLAGAPDDSSVYSDHHFVVSQIRAHQVAIALYRQEATTGADTDLQRHLLAIHCLHFGAAYSHGGHCGVRELVNVETCGN